MKFLLLLFFVIFINNITFCQEPTAKEIVKHKIKSIYVEDTTNHWNKISYYNDSGLIVKKIYKKTIPYELEITTSYIYKNNFLIYEINYDNYKKENDTTFFDYDTFGNLIYIFKNDTHYPELIEYVYSVSVSPFERLKKNYTLYQKRIYHKARFYFYPTHKKIEYKNYGTFYLQEYSSGFHETFFSDNGKFKYKLFYQNDSLNKTDSFYLYEQIERITHNDSTLQEIVTIYNQPSFNFFTGNEFYENGVEFFSNGRIQKSTINKYSNGKISKQSYKNFKTQYELTFVESSYSYDKNGLLIQIESDLKEHLFGKESKPLTNFSFINYTYQFW